MNPSPVCVDASLLIPLVIGGSHAAQVAELWKGWHEAGHSLLAPTLLYYEVANALRRYVVHGELLPEEAAAALQIAIDLEITLYPGFTTASTIMNSNTLINKGMMFFDQNKPV